MQGPKEIGTCDNMRISERLNKSAKRLYIELVAFVLVVSAVPTLAYPTPASAAASLEGYVNGPTKVAYGNTFSIIVAIRNGGDKTAYMCRLLLNVPAGFSASKTSITVGDLGPGQTRTFTATVRAPSYATRGTFTGTVFYSSSLTGGGTSFVARVGGLTVSVERGYVITFVVSSGLGQIESGTVYVYDLSGRQVALGVGTRTGDLTPIYVKVNLLYGQYRGTASFSVNVPKASTWHYRGSVAFTADRDKSVNVFCNVPWPLPV